MIEDFKKTSPRAWRQIAREKAIDVETIEIWFQDEARIGQKNKITRRWAKRGTRPSAPRDQRTASTYIFGAVCPKQGKGAALILPACNTEAMNLHLAEIAKTVAPGAHAVLLVDQAGWHMSTRLVVPPNITIIAAAAEIPRAQPGRERLAVHARQLALQPRLQILRRSRRPLLRGMEQARRSALAHHVHRIAPMGARVLISGTWYKSGWPCDQLAREHRQAIRHAFGRARLEYDVLVLDIPEFAQAAAESTVVRVSFDRPVEQHTDPWNPPTNVLRVRRERRCRRTGKQRDEFAPFHCQCFPCFRRKRYHSAAALRDFNLAYAPLRVIRDRAIQPRCRPMSALAPIGEKKALRGRFVRDVPYRVMHRNKQRLIRSPPRRGRVATSGR